MPQCEYNQLQRNSEIMKSKAYSIKPSRTMRALYYWGKFIGIFSLTLSRNNELEFSCFSQFYGSFLAATYGYIIYNVLSERISTMIGEPPIAIIIDFIGLISVFLENTFAWLIGAFYQNRMKLVIDGFARVDEMLRKLGSADNCDKRLGQLAIQLSLVNTLYFASILVNNAAITSFPKFRSIIFTCYTLPRIAALNMGTVYLWSLVIVKEKFGDLNEKVRSLMSHDCVRAIEVEEAYQRSISTRFLTDRINTISQLHRGLRDVIGRIEDHFGIFVFFTVATHFSDITINVYSMYVVTKIKGTTYVHFIGISYWVFLSVAILTAIANTCASTTHEANKTGHILHAMLTNSGHYCDSREAAKFHVLSLNLLHNQVRMTLYGFVELDDFLVYRSIAASVTYLVIILQFYG